MKTVMALIIAAILIPFTVCSRAEAVGEMHIRCIEGDVLIKFLDGEDWVPGAMNTPVSEGDHIWVPEGGKTELQARNGTIIRIDENSFMEVLAIENDLTRIYMGIGNIYIRAALSNGDVFAIEAPFASLRAYEESRFRIHVADNGNTTVAVLQGRVYAERPAGQLKIETNEQYLFRHDSEYPQLTYLAGLNEQDAWNMERDSELNSDWSSSTYLPEELKVYSNDFERNGRWINTVDYGYVWTPTVVSATSWAPYSAGRWTWIRGDYVWISHEPWGWAPYHYGRWAHVTSIGWCWVPPSRGFAYWSPGYVAWVHTPTHVAWVPLAPGEVYYGRGFYGPYSMNVNVHKTTTNIFYKNIHVKSAVTTVHRNSFISGQPAKPTKTENIFLVKTKTAGVPNFRLDRTSYMPVVKDIPPGKMPPPQVMQAKRDYGNKRDSIRGSGPVEGPKAGRFDNNKKEGYAVRPGARWDTTPIASGKDTHISRRDTRLKELGIGPVKRAPDAGVTAVPQQHHPTWTPSAASQQKTGLSSDKKRAVSTGAYTKSTTKSQIGATGLPLTDHKPTGWSVGASRQDRGSAASVASTPQKTDKPVGTNTTAAPLIRGGDVRKTQGGPAGNTPIASPSNPWGSKGKTQTRPSTKDSSSRIAPSGGGSFHGAQNRSSLSPAPARNTPSTTQRNIAPTSTQRNIAPSTTQRNIAPTSPQRNIAPSTTQRNIAPTSPQTKTQARPQAKSQGRPPAR